MNGIYWEEGEVITCEALWIEADSITKKKTGHKTPHFQRGVARGDVVARVQDALHQQGLIRGDLYRRRRR